jgi:hypothetical protein
MTDAPFLYGGTVPGVDPATGKIWPEFLPEGSDAPPGSTLTQDPAKPWIIHAS